MHSPTSVIAIQTVLKTMNNAGRFAYLTDDLSIRSNKLCLPESHSRFKHFAAPSIKCVSTLTHNSSNITSSVNDITFTHFHFYFYTIYTFYFFGVLCILKTLHILKIYWRRSLYVDTNITTTAIFVNL